MPWAKTERVKSLKVTAGPATTLGTVTMLLCMYVRRAYFVRIDQRGINNTYKIVSMCFSGNRSVGYLGGCVVGCSAQR